MLKYLLQLIPSNVYYNLEICHIPTLKNELKKKLISISAREIKTYMYYPDRMIFFENIHKMNNRAMPDAIMSYKCPIQLFKLYNDNEMSMDWVNLNLNQTFTTRRTTFSIFKTNVSKVGLNQILYRILEINGLIPFINGII